MATSFVVMSAEPSITRGSNDKAEMDGHGDAALGTSRTGLLVSSAASNMERHSADGDAADRGESRRMTRCELLGQHTHPTTVGIEVHVWRRNGKYLARGRYGGAPFGETLGADPVEASARLRRLMCEIENGTYLRPSERPNRPLSRAAAPRLSIRELCDDFLVDKRALRGKKTARDYRNRLVPLIQFAEGPEVRKRWPLAADIDRQFAIEFRTFLHRRIVTRNGHPAASERCLSPGQIFNILDCTRTLFWWAKRPEINRAPAEFVNPFREEIVGYRPSKDPLRTSPLPLERRITLVRHMDRWQLCQFAIGTVLALRPEDYTGLLISEVDFSECVLHFGRRLAGWDFNKGRRSFQVPFPVAIEPLLRKCVDGRHDGPLLRKRTVVEGRRRPSLLVDSSDDIRTHFERALMEAKPEEIQTAQDGKQIFRRLLLGMGGVSEDSLAKEFKGLLRKIDASAGIRFYDLRGSVNTDMNAAKVSHLFQLYVTGHSVDAEILSAYVSLELQREMEGYFNYIEPLLVAIEKRTGELISV